MAALHIVPSSGNNRGNLRLLTASCLCLLALRIRLPAVFVLWQGLLHTASPFTLHRTIFLEVTDSSMPSCCLLPWKYTFSRLTVKWRHSWGMGSGDVPLYCSVVNKKFCIPAVSCYFLSSPRWWSHQNSPYIMLNTQKSFSLFFFSFSVQIVAVPEVAL